MTREARYIKLIQRERRAQARQVKIVQQRRRQLGRLRAQKGRVRKSVTWAAIAAWKRRVKREESELARIRANLAKHERVLQRLRHPQTERQKLARAILDHPNIRFVFVSATGGSARPSLEAQAAGKRAYCAWLGTSTDLSVDMLRFVLACCHADPTYLNCTTNGRHVDRDGHPRGWCSDLDRLTRISMRALLEIAARHGARKNSETSHHHFNCPPRWGMRAP